MAYPKSYFMYNLLPSLFTAQQPDLFQQALSQFIMIAAFSCVHFELAFFIEIRKE